MSEELKACPFCGGEAWIDYHEGSYEYGGWADISCSVCGVDMGVTEDADSGESLKGRAVKKWNTRQPNV